MVSKSMSLLVISLFFAMSTATLLDTQSTTYYLAGIKGFYNGYEVGFYKTEKEIGTGCMNA